MTAKHPPTYDCIACTKSFHAPFALEDHYRGSQNHPNCVRCGRGFLDDAAREEVGSIFVPLFFFFFETRLQHLRVAHPKVPCGPCGGIVLYEDALPQHYSDSSNHPSCLRCNKGFKDDSAYSEVSSPFIVQNGLVLWLWHHETLITNYLLSLPFPSIYHPHIRICTAKHAKQALIRLKRLKCTFGPLLCTQSAIAAVWDSGMKKTEIL